MNDKPIRNPPSTTAFVIYKGALVAAFAFVVWIVVSTLNMTNVEIVRQTGIQWNGKAYMYYTCMRYQLMSSGFEDWGVDQELDLSRIAIKKCPFYNGQQYIKKALWDSRDEVRHRGYELWIRGNLAAPDVNRYVLDKLIEEGPTYFNADDPPERTLGIVKFMFSGECRNQIHDLLRKYEPIKEIDPTRRVGVKLVSTNSEELVLDKSCPHKIERINPWR